MITVMTDQRRRRTPEAALQIPINVRLPRHLRAYVALRAEMDDTSVAAFVRATLETALDAEPEILQDVGEGLTDAQQEQLGMGTPLRAFLKLMDPDDVPELAARLRAAEDA
jgi:hypothetical protein